MRGIRQDIQGLRALAVTAVVLDHAAVPGVAGGYIGVDMFFVVSGFLITGQLLRRLRKTGRIGFADFYARRARRILPASFTVLALTVGGVFLFVPPTLRAQAMTDAAAVALYVPNYVFAVRGTDYLANTTPSVFQHYWSLGVEEQFYLLWPALLGVAWVLLRRRRRAIAAVLGVLAIVSLVVGIWLTRTNEPWAFFALWPRAWELAAGGLLAIAAPTVRRLLPAWGARILGWAGVAGIVVGCVVFTADTTFPGTAALLPVLATAAVIAAGEVPARGSVVSLLRLRPFQFLGAISYSLYLVHWPLEQLPQAAVGYEHPLPLYITLALAVLAVPLAWIMYRWLENPVRHARFFAKARPRRSLFAALAGSSVLAAVSVVALVGAANATPSTGRVVAATPPSVPLQETSFVPANLKPALTQAQNDNPALYSDGCELNFSQSTPHPCASGPSTAPTVVLWGDSAAAQWAPGLQQAVESAGDRFVTQTKSGCASTLIDHVRNGQPYPSCDAWRTNVLAQLKKNPPAVVVLASYDNEELPKGKNAEQQWADGLANTISQIPSQTRVLLMSDSPDFGVNPVDCLSQHLTDAKACAQPKSKALSSPGRTAAQNAAKQTRAQLIDLTDYFCTDTVCPAIVGNTLIYRDSHHLTASFSSALAPALSAKLAPYLP
ncbi:acyltransferase family protein [Gryllotalpicola reticulitermitis]|uniref:Acyltransferase family protein n=1 Tax=Gryllotalpicola reticulitermitis TaxID=1184153 RepID=A0ABV8Q5J3_9MICO